ncbi:MAG: MlaD family protein [Rhodospirillaceae bacterium]|nr:MlaD family protein [Rhodospirillaceae bacterium]
MADFNWREVWLGLGAVFFAFILFVTLTIDTSQSKNDVSQALTIAAEFGRIDGLVIGSPVRMAGINIGNVGTVELSDDQRALVTLVIEDSSLIIPVDTAAAIETDGIFGEKYIELYPGGDIKALSAGQRISYVQDSVVLETLFNQVVSRAKASRTAGERNVP